MREAARRIGVPETTYREWEYGRAIRGEPYPKIAAAFGVSLEVLFGAGVSEDVTIENRLKRISEEVTAIHDQIKKLKIK